jgi:23S rRNA U2552 (ribose-2'-O)-methylase RlmE/FtsJ
MYIVKKLEKINSNPQNNTNAECVSIGDPELLNLAKNAIDSVDQIEWTKIRKATNIYESPCNVGNIKNKKIVSRAFYKLWEILVDFDIPTKGDSFHICDAPGGFIQAMMAYKPNTIDLAFTVSLMSDDDQDVPQYNKSLLSNKNVRVLETMNKNDITNCATIIDILKKMKPCTNINVITGDGGITEKNGDYNNKEVNHLVLIASQILLGLSVLNNNGYFILKIFDIYTLDTVQLLMLLNGCFEEIYITKPNTSRPTNSEKYIVCKKFSKDSFCSSTKNSLFRFIFSKKNSGLKIQNVPMHFIEQIKKINNLFTEAQIKCIDNNIDIINQNTCAKKKIINDFADKKRIFCKNWLIKYRVNLL